MEHDRDFYSDCVKHRKDYLTKKQEIMTKFRENKNQCEKYISQKIDGNRCESSQNTTLVKSANASVSGNINPQQQCTENNSLSNSAINRKRMSLQKSDLQRQCMMDLGWQNHHSYRLEIKDINQQYGYDVKESN
jgi:hypothetical protein